MNFLSLWGDARKAVRQGRPGIERRQQQRLAEAIAHARTHSRFYRELYDGLPDQISDPRLLPVTDKRHLMARFDDWVSDPDVTLEQARAFADDPALVGAQFRDTYLLTTTSGTTGNVAIFLNDRHTLAVAAALAIRAIVGSNGLTPGIVLKALIKGGRTVKIAGTGGHFAVAAAEMAQQRAHQRRGKPQLSHTVLLSTLYKREQPVLRYDLGDSILRRPDPCPCGSPFMAIRLQGRSASVLTFTTENAERVTIVPLALATAVERTSGVELFQLGFGGLHQHRL
ncbi:hypothetical protein ACIA5D_43420 [Actinoplanes sp. NPDC051513]|uniref:hypothetical protein n=1 Tax=Actinoplanes sp. NPDC051513 TaxID=3363908 RepID=UPI0037A5AC81